MACKSAVLEFCHNTHIGGLPRIVKNKRIGFRLFWVLFSLIIYALAAYYIANQVIHYMEYPTTITTGEIFNEAPPMPAVTLCDQLPFPASRQATSGVSTTYSQYLSQAQTTTECNNCTPDQQKLMSRLRSKVMTRQGYFQYLTSAQRLSVGHTQAGFILECSAMSGPGERRDCSAVFEITPHSLPDYFTCFALTPKTDAKVHGLEVTLFLDRSAPGGDPANIDYNSREGPLGGVRVIPHKPNTSYNNREGFDINPGMISNVKLQKREREMLPPPYGSCSDDDDISNTEGTCMREYAERDCGCTPVVDESDPPSPGKPYCLNISAGIETLTGMQACLDNFRPYHCDVRTPCNQGNYDVTIQTSKWPTNNQMDSFRTTVLGYQGYPYTTGQSGDISREYVDENFIRLHLAVDPRITVISQQAAVTVVELVTSIGWTLCMLCGFTLFFFVEILECLFKMCCGVDQKDDSYKVTV